MRGGEALNPPPVIAIALPFALLQRVLACYDGCAFPLSNNSRRAMSVRLWNSSKIHG